MYKFASIYDSANICLNDASKLLYTDLEDNADRQAMLSYLSSNVSALSATGGLMLAQWTSVGNWICRLLRRATI